MMTLTASPVSVEKVKLRFGYEVLSRYRTELMGVAMLWVMLFHTGDMELKSMFFNGVRSLGFGGVVIFILNIALGALLHLLIERVKLFVKQRTADE